MLVILQKYKTEKFSCHLLIYPSTTTKKYKVKILELKEKKKKHRTSIPLQVKPSF